MAQQFMLILFEKPGDFASMSPEEIQKIIEQYGAWGGKVAAAGQMVGGHKLREEGGKRMTQTAGKLAVTDGPYAETKEVIGGVYLIKADSYDAAVKIASDCPHLKFGRIEDWRIGRPAGLAPARRFFRPPLCCPCGRTPPERRPKMRIRILIPVFIVLSTAALTAP